MKFAGYQFQLFISTIRWELQLGAGTIRSTSCGGIAISSSTANHGSWNEALRLKMRSGWWFQPPKTSFIGIIWFNYITDLSRIVRWNYVSFFFNLFQLTQVQFLFIPSCSALILLDIHISHDVWKVRDQKRTLRLWTAVCSRSSMIEWSVWSAPCCIQTSWKLPMLQRLIWMSLPTALQNCHLLIYIYHYISMQLTLVILQIADTVNLWFTPCSATCVQPLSANLSHQ